ncbi:MAG: hypothetical protein JNM89_09250 [Hyphomicrobiaceae bacterium]|nr:hypothetical protein [Hyphomicrobiaceae bacterium]
MQPNSTRWRVPPLAWLPIALAVAAETASNALRAYGLGAHLDRFTLSVDGQAVSVAGGVLVLAAIAVSLSQARAAWVALTPSAPARQRVVSGLAAALLLAISVSAMASHILEAQRARTADEGGARGRYDRAKAAHDKAAGELAALSGVRSIADVKAALDAAPVPRTVFVRTKQCTDVTRDDSFRDCKPILDLRQEMGRAIRKAELEPEAKTLRDELARTERPEEATASEQAVSGVWAWIMGLGVVFVATFGAVIFARVDAVPPANDNAAAVPVPLSPIPPVPPGDSGSVVDWVREFRAHNGRRPHIPELQARFPGTSKTTAWRRCKAA